jgi:hypothetical protein
LVRMRGIKNQNERRISNILNFHALLNEAAPGKNG